MTVGSTYLGRNSRPGQFVEVRCSNGIEPLLRRPLGVHRITRAGIELLYEVIGKGTEMLSRKRPGETLDLIGPLGNGFDITRTTNDPAPLGPSGLGYGAGERRTTILIAGGIGVAPLVALAQNLAYSGQRIAYRKKNRIHVFIGAKTKERILCENDFKKLGCTTHVSTDNGSKGRKGLVSESLSDFLNAKRHTLNATVYACGPIGMLKAVAKIAAGYRIPCQVSLEERMACGVGACLGCPVKVLPKVTGYGLRVTGYEYKMVCKDGPVFDAEEIAW
jgi:dihydroorotate dehydrogenase electron transfer subunit